MNKIIKKFNGKKTAIGAVLLFFAAMPHIGDLIGKEALDIIQYIGMSFTAIGLTHKAIKVESKIN